MPVTGRVRAAAAISCSSTINEDVVPFFEGWPPGA